MSIRTCSACVVLLALLAGCGHDSPTPDQPVESTSPTPSARAFDLPAAQWPDACTLLTPDDVAAALGGGAATQAAGAPAVLSTGATTAVPGSCTWTTTDGSAVELAVRNVVYPVTAYFASVKVRSFGLRVLEDLGDDAFDPMSGPARVVVCKGHTIFTLDVRPLGQDASLEARPGATTTAEALAALAVPRITGPASEPEQES